VKLGIIPPYGLAPVEDGDFARAFARLAEELGFESLWPVEHVVEPVDYRSLYPYDPSGRMPVEGLALPDPLAWLGFVAGATSRIRLAPGILILPQRNPVVLAKELASLDRLSGGRMMLGVGLGWLREEADAVGTSFDDRAERAEEAIAAMRALWRTDVASFAGKHFAFTRVRSSPKPLQPRGVPIVIGGHSNAAARRAGRIGDGFFPLGVTLDRLAELRAELERSARTAARQPELIEITCLGPADPDAARGYAAEGVARMVVFAPSGDLDELRRVLAPLTGAK
jgi:probable F420-dependent oxidoreductase